MALLGSPLRSPNGRWRTVATRFERLHGRYRRLFWTLHSFWALLTGVAVLVLAHNRYGYVPWVVFFLALTWASTLFFSRLARSPSSAAMRFAQGFVSYLTRVMYQETLFFLIPFYFYSATFPSWNSAYVIVLAALAVLSCFDLVFDRLMRSSRPFALAFFTVVSFSALQFLFPLVFGLRVDVASYVAAALAVFAAVPLAFPLGAFRRPRGLLAVAGAVVLALAFVWASRPAIPPVPLRLVKVRFASEFDPSTLRAPEEYSGTMPLESLGGRRLYAIATVFAPTDLPTSISIRFLHDGKQVRASRTLDLVVHSRGFRVYDALRPGRHGFRAGRYVLEVWTADRQLVGRASIDLVSPS
jgi:hypothetical protein